MNNILGFDEIGRKAELRKEIPEDYIDTLTDLMVTYEVDMSYLETAWPKGLVLLHILKEKGLEVVNTRYLKELEKSKDL